MRQGNLKLIEFYEDHRLELYNLRNDMGEEHNLANAMPAETERLHGLLAAWRKSVDAQMPTPNPDYQPAKRK